MRRLADDSGQVVAFTVIAFIALMGVAALSVDAGSWYTDKRKLQRAADAATLAGAQDLPDQTAATTTATTYANANMTGLNSWSPSYPAANEISISLSRPSPGFFAKTLGIDSVTVHAHARAAVGVPLSLSNVAPIAVRDTAACTTASLSCFGTTKTLNFSESNLSSSKFGLINVSCQGGTATTCSSASIGSSDLDSWIRNGYQGYLDVQKWFAAVPGEKVGPVRDALESMVGKTLLFPVFDSVDTTVQAYHVIGWAAYVIDVGGVESWKNDVPGCTPNCKLLRGQFTEYVAHGISNVNWSPTATNYGVRVIQLFE